MEELLVGPHASTVATCLSPPCLGYVRLGNRSVRAAVQPHVLAIVSEALEAVVPNATAREHYRQILDVENAMAILTRRRWLQEVNAATTFSQWRTETAVARLMIGAEMDGFDFFSALKRAFLASQVPALATTPGVIRWMNVLGAAEEQDPVQMRLLAREAWEAVVGETGLAEEAVLWVVQHAHFVDALDDAGGWLMVRGGPSHEEVTAFLEALKKRLEEAPSAGRYGPPGDPSYVKAMHVRKALRGLLPA